MKRLTLIEARDNEAYEEELLNYEEEDEKALDSVNNKPFGESAKKSGLDFWVSVCQGWGTQVRLWSVSERNISEGMDLASDLVKCTYEDLTLSLGASVPKTLLGIPNLERCSGERFSKV
ncbi:hypothetical protein RHSIM_Rhsim12G0008500 [Rhododendron simsii]|uniref:Uncharacterized protein n=1 Tax=Rhododendron simsii TaxID=118357 RepID=A0A834G4T5_RHOSS|nr:hypothetical protein RHSIM_Rhsim12G0008500 [Rhododendron simsii]